MCRNMTDIPGLMPGWACCKCNIYNGAQRLNCKFCKSGPCNEEVKEMITSWTFITTKPEALKRWKPTMPVEKGEEN